MGFLENLRQKIAAESQARQRGEDILRQRQQQQEAERLRREAQEATYHRTRQNQAAAFFDESGVGNLVSELGKLSGGYHKGYPTSGKWGDGWFGGPEWVH